VLDKTGSLPVSFPVQIIYRIVSYRAFRCLSHWPWAVCATCKLLHRWL